MRQVTTSLKLYLMQQDKTNHHKLQRVWDGKKAPHTAGAAGQQEFCHCTV